MNKIFKVGDLVDYCGISPAFIGKVGVVTALDSGAKRSAYVWCLFGSREIVVQPRHLRLIKNRRDK